MKLKKVFVINAGLAILLLAACNALGPSPVPTQSVPTQTALPATGVEYRFVTDRLLLPTTREQSQAFAMNVDGDLQEHTDNLFGTLLTLLSSAAPSLEMQSTVDQAVKTGQIVTLHTVKGDDPLNDSSVSWTVIQGQQSPSEPRFDGTDQFTFDSKAPANLPIAGSLSNGHFTGGPGTARVQMIFMNQSVDVNLIGVRLEADFTSKGCANGKMGGGVTVEEFQGKLLPAITDGLNQVIKADPAAAKPLLQAFDSDQDGTITIQEIQNNPVLLIVASPDLDLLDASGAFNPNQDGVKDSYSVGLGFSCVGALFSLPAGVGLIP